MRYTIEYASVHPVYCVHIHIYPKNPIIRLQIKSFFNKSKNCSIFQVMCNSGGLTEIPLKNIPITVEQLSLSKNVFPIIKSDAFAGLRALKKISLDDNNITTIKPFAFRGCMFG